jgi:uncharacterized protein (DUF2237 family)
MREKAWRFAPPKFFPGIGIRIGDEDMAEAKNVLGDALEVCCTSSMTGFYRTGTCETGRQDAGTHVVCAQVTEEFLTFTKARGNDLMTPAPEHGFPGLKPGDRWCLCATRWREALEAGVAPPVILGATYEAAFFKVCLFR